MAQHHLDAAASSELSRPSPKLAGRPPRPGVRQKAEERLRDFAYLPAPVPETPASISRRDKTYAPDADLLVECNANGLLSNDIYPWIGVLRNDIPQAHSTAMTRRYGSPPSGRKHHAPPDSRLESSQRSQ
jgi:hypothetical protein